jgi:phosphatidylserine/phosphatidylglycerophosphate/cardiolipin synthase-like enzyme
MKKRILSLLFILSLFMQGCVYHNFKAMPVGTDYAGDTYFVSEDQVSFLYDLTYQEDGKRIAEQEIFDTMFEHIEKAQKYILLDMFLFNKYMGKEDQSYRDICGEMTDLLIKKSTVDNVTIDFITDPINNVYGGDISPELTRMSEAGINVIVTNLDKLPDSNVIYSPFWRTFIQWFGNSTENGIFPHPFNSEGKVTLRSYLRLLNFKANHRKVFLADYGDTWASIVTSANPHNGSSAHCNVGILIYGDFASDLYVAEKAVAEFSDSKLSQYVKAENSSEGDLKLKLISEREIKKHLLIELERTTKNDSIKIGMFYLSDRDVVENLISASKRGVNIKIILDANKDAFGRKKNGVPNRPVAYELQKKSNGKIRIKWYNTHGEQFHAKFILIQHYKKEDTLILGSANLTKRNIGNENLELNVELIAEDNTDIMHDVREYYNLIWYDEKYCLDYKKYYSKSLFKTMLYRLAEGLGASTF